MKKGAATGHEPAVGELFKGHHVSLHISEREELATLADDIQNAIVKAGGANYDLGNIRSGVSAGAAASIKAHSKEFFAAKDETERKGVRRLRSRARRERNQRVRLGREVYGRERIGSEREHDWLRRTGYRRRDQRVHEEASRNRGRRAS
jgi:hypothetical protein